MGVQNDRTRQKYVVRWREDGRQRNRRFASEAEAIEFDASLRLKRRNRTLQLDPPETAASGAKGDGVYSYRIAESSCSSPPAVTHD